MKFLKFVLALVLSVSLIYFLNTSWNFGSAIPPLGKLTDPFRGFWQNAETGDTENCTLSLEGLHAPVEVIYDSADIPHIFAKNDYDLYLAQGYVTAQHRLWQMEFQTHAAAGRLSEIVGAAALDYDRGQRRQGMVLGAQNSLKLMQDDPKMLEAITAYTKGVNSFIQHLNPSDLPFEYKLLGYQPEPWTELKVGFFLMNMAKTLCASENDFEMTNALKLLGKEKLDLLFPDRDSPSDPIVDNAGNWKFKPVELSMDSSSKIDLVNLNTIEKMPRGIGSNNWAVSGKKTASGSPILCSDPHLGLSMPSIWYAIHLNSPSVNVMGASFPGAPAVIIGFNDSIAWGPTNAQRDLVDWYKITFKDKSKNEYLSDGQWRASTKVIEKIKIKGKPDFYDTITFTHHGPITYDESFHGESERNHYAYRWLAHDGGNVLRAFYELNRGKNHSDYMAALDHHYFPAQNFAFASVAGDVAIRVQGKYPVRRKDEGKFILDGTKTSTEWKPFIPFDQNIMIKNPERGFVSSANQYPVDSTYPYYVHGINWENYRNRRINRVLTASKQITPYMMMQLQNDNYNIQAEEYLPLLLDAIQSAPLNESEKTIVEQLSKWNFENEAIGTSPSYFEAWVEALQLAIWDEFTDQAVALPIPTDYTTWWLLKNRPDLSYYDIVKTPEKEDRNAIVLVGFRKGIERIKEWEAKNGKPADWTHFKDSYVRHLLRIEPLSIHAKNGGNANTPNASRGNWGPSWRMVVSMEKPIKAWGIYPGGQSGNPGSKHYDDFIKRWEEARPLPLKFVNNSKALSNTTYYSLTLNPVTK